MRASVNRLEHLALDVLSQSAGFVREQTSEVAGLVAEREHGDDAVETVDACNRGPLSEGVDLRHALTDTSAHAAYVDCRATVASRRDPAKRAAQGVAGR